jgi:serine/threonine protein kinase
MAHQDKAIAFKNIILFKDQTLGIGTYGAVCKAKCDDLLCAAKIIHPTLFDPTTQLHVSRKQEHRLPIKRFEVECEFMSTVRHPNIVQYLCMHQDPDTGLSVLLMELMDDSLTHFLESSPQPIPYHIQINICHDITLALSFLHSNGIVHRDLSSNNVLMIGNMRAKVTDFGMVRLGDQFSRATPLTFAMCPGTDVYMPPEAVKDKPVYTEKIDCFSFGVIAVQIATRQFPEPGDRHITLDDPRYPQGAVNLRVPEIERRQNHIIMIDPNHPLKQVPLDCLKDIDVERPSAQQLCERVAAMKEQPQYSESVREARSTVEHDSSDERDKELWSLRQQHSQQVQGFQQIIESQTSCLAEKDQTIALKEQTITQNSQTLREKDETIAELREQIRQLEKEKGVVVEEKERELRQKVDVTDQLGRQLGHFKQWLEESEQIIAQFQKQVAELEQLRSATDMSSSSKVERDTIKLTWQKGKEAPYKVRSSYCAAVDGSTLYIIVDQDRSLWLCVAV